MVVVVREVYVDVEIVVVLGVGRVIAYDIIFFAKYRVECGCCGMEEEMVLKVLPGGWVVEVYRVCGKVCAVVRWG
jgi:hypothetical protein